MTDSEIDRIMRTLTDMRVESADRFARIETRMDSVGKFGIRDVYLFVGAVAAAAGVARFTIGG